jgi:hypothetical protein
MYYLILEILEGKYGGAGPYVPLFVPIAFEDAVLGGQ